MAPDIGANRTLNLSKLTCLVIDDSAAARQIHSQMLRALGMGNVIECGSGRAAQDVIRQRPIDLVITDGRMPGLDGYAFIRWLRTLEHAENRFTPVLLVTAEGRHAHVVRGLDVGASAVIVKPMTPETLVAQMRLLALDQRQFIESEDYAGPDRRSKNTGPPQNSRGRRAEDREFERAVSPPARVSGS